MDPSRQTKRPPVGRLHPAVDKTGGIGQAINFSMIPMKAFISKHNMMDCERAFIRYMNHRHGVSIGQTVESLRSLRAILYAQMKDTAERVGCSRLPDNVDDIGKLRRSMDPLNNIILNRMRDMYIKNPELGNKSSPSDDSSSLSRDCSVFVGRSNIIPPNDEVDRPRMGNAPRKKNPVKRMGRIQEDTISKGNGGGISQSNSSVADVSSDEDETSIDFRMKKMLADRRGLDEPVIPVNDIPPPDETVNSNKLTKADFDEAIASMSRHMYTIDEDYGSITDDEKHLTQGHHEGMQNMANDELKSTSLEHINSAYEVETRQRKQEEREGEEDGEKGEEEEGGKGIDKEDASGSDGEGNDSIIASSIDDRMWRGSGLKDEPKEIRPNSNGQYVIPISNREGLLERALDSQAVTTNEDSLILSKLPHQHGNSDVTGTGDTQKQQQQQQRQKKKKDCTKSGVQNRVGRTTLPEGVFSGTTAGIGPPLTDIETHRREGHALPWTDEVYRRSKPMNNMRMDFDTRGASHLDFMGPRAPPPRLESLKFLCVNGFDRDWSIEPYRYSYTARLVDGGTRFTDVTALQATSIIIPAEIKQGGRHSRITPDYVPDKMNFEYSFSFSYPYVSLMIEGMDSVYEGTNDTVRRSFCQFKYQRHYQAPNGRGYVQLDPLQHEIKRFFPTPLGSLGNLSISVRKPNGTLFNNSRDDYRVLKVQYLSFQPNFLQVILDRTFDRNEFFVGDTVLLKVALVPESSQDLPFKVDDMRRMEAFLNRSEGHEIMELAETNENDRNQGFYLFAPGTLDQDAGELELDEGAIAALVDYNQANPLGDERNEGGDGSGGTVSSIGRIMNQSLQNVVCFKVWMSTVDSTVMLNKGPTEGNALFPSMFAPLS